MKRRSFLKALGAVLVAPALPIPKADTPLTINGIPIVSKPCLDVGVGNRRDVVYVTAWHNYSHPHSMADKDLLEKMGKALKNTKFTPPFRCRPWPI